MKLARPATAGYSGTPLAKKLGIAPGMAVLAVGAPDDYEELLAPLPDGVVFVKTISPSVGVVHLFTTKRADLAKRLAAWRHKIAPNATVWVSWPKRASKVATDIT